MSKLALGPLILFVLVGTALSAFAGFLFGANLGGNFGCFEFAGATGYESCSYFYAIIGAALGFILSIFIGKILKKVLAIIVLIVLLLLLFGSSIIPTLRSVPQANRVIESVDNTVNKIESVNSAIDSVKQLP